MSTAAPDVSRRFVRVFSAVCLGLLAAVAVSNIVCDPLGYYGTGIVEAATWSTRARKVELAAAFGPAHAVVLGSSRVMQLDLEVLGDAAGGPAFDAAVDSAMAEDVAAMLGYLTDELHWTPRVVLVGLDPEMLHPSNPPDGRAFGVPALRDRFPWPLRAQLVSNVLTAAVSWGQARATASLTWVTLRGTRPAPTTAIDANGRLRYLDWEEASADGRWEPDFEGSIHEYEGRFAGLERGFDPAREALFVATVERLARTGARVEVFLTPLHDTLRAALTRDRAWDAIHARSLALLDRVASLDGVDVTDCSDPSVFGADPAGWVDGAHVDRNNGARLVHHLLED